MEASAKQSRQRCREFLEDLRRQQAAYDRKFSDLPIIESLRDRCESSNIHPEDPIFLIIEILGLFDERQRSTVRELVHLSSTHLEYQDAVLDQLELTLEELQPCFQESAKIRAAITGMTLALDQLSADNSAFLQALPLIFHGFTDAALRLEQTAGSYQESTQQVLSVAKTSVFFNLVLPLISFVIGVSLTWFFLGKPTLR